MTDTILRCLRAAVCVAFIAAAAGCGPPRGAGGRVLRIGTDATYPPLESLDGERFVGYDIDVGGAVAKEIGAKPQWVNCGFDGIFAALQAGKFDFVISSVTITPERRQSILFSRPYYTAGQAIAWRKGAEPAHRPEQLSGKTVGIQINTTAKQVLKAHSSIRIREYNSIDLALLDLQHGNVDAVMTDSPVLRYMLARGYKDLTGGTTLLTEEHYGIALRPEEKALAEEIDGALGRLEQRGEMARLRAKWFGEKAAAATGASPKRLLPIVAPALAKAALVTIALTFASLLAGLPLGLALALGRISRYRFISIPSAIYIEVLRGTPLLVQLFAIYYVLPAAGIQLSQWPAALLAFALNSSAYVAEIFRAGIQSLDSGQMEAARSLGMPYALAMRLVILPQAFRRVVPPLTNEAIALLKDTSLVSVIAMVELTREGQQLTGALAAPMLIWPLVGAYYLVLTLPLTQLANWLERRWSVSSRNTA